MNKSMRSVFFVFVFLTVLLSGCTPASTPVPTSIPLTSTPEPTPLPALPTFTQEPEPTKTTTPNPITSIKVLLPEQYQCKQIENSSDGNEYTHVWVALGSAGSNPKWVIVEQKLVVESPTSAKEFLETIFTNDKSTCTDILYDEPEVIDVEGHETSVGRYMCAERKGANNGAFTDQRVAVQGNDVYIVISDIQIPISPKAGVLPYQDDQQDELQNFMTMQELSANFIRDFVKICTSETVDC